MWLILILSIPLVVQASIDCALQPLLRGVSAKQSLGQSQKKVYPSEPNCKSRCIQETSFNCTAILWGADGTSDCYLFDKVNLDQEIFVDERSYILYYSVCDGEPSPSVGYCQFLLNQTGVTAPAGLGSVSPRMTTESSCREFCIANYWGQNCDAFVVSTDRASTCTLYPNAPSTTLATGPQNLWTKNCFPPPQNCEYTTWTEWTGCTVSCGNGTRSRTRGVAIQASGKGIPCMDSEKSQTGSCGTQDCSAGCIYNEWTAFGDCNATCSTTGLRSRTRTVLQGNSCPSSDMVDYKECASTIECGRSCIYSTWTEWTPCNVSCLTTRTRTLEMGEAAACEIEYGPLLNNMVCEGGACSGTGQGSATVTPAQDSPVTAGGGVTPTAKPSGNTVGVQPVTNGPEPGCKIPSVDPSSKVSSKGYKAVGARQDCAAMCKSETSFTCAGYITAGPGSPCVLHGEIDQPVVCLTNSRYYLQDVGCKTNSSSSAGVCSWQQIGVGSDPSFSTPGHFVSIGLTIDAPHCGTLCSMNWPIFRPNPCVAYAWSPLIPFESGQDNCYMYDWNAVANFSKGQFELYHLQCPQ